MKNSIQIPTIERIQLYEKASLKKVIDEYKESLSISHFNIIPVKKFSLEKFLSDTSENIKVKSIEPLRINATNFLPYFNDYASDIDTRINKFISDKKISHQEKIKTVSLLITECTKMVLTYYPFNQNLVFFNFNWKCENTIIPFSRLNLKESDFQIIKNEINLRFEFFQFINMKLELCKMKLESDIPNLKLVNWKKTKRPELLITEIILALEEKGYIAFSTEQHKTEFIANLKKIFALKDFKWSEMINEINRREKFRYKILRELLKDI